jgi:hypothetical protein
MPKSRTAKAGIPNSLYTAILAVAFGVIVATAGFVAYSCFTQYGTIFGVG